MIRIASYPTQDWAGAIVFPSDVAWIWAAVLFIPLIVSAAAIVVDALREHSTAERGGARLSSSTHAPAAPPSIVAQVRSVRRAEVPLTREEPATAAPLAG
jgi:hypothetical protein